VESVESGPNDGAVLESDDSTEKMSPAKGDLAEVPLSLKVFDAPATPPRLSLRIGTIRIGSAQDNDLVIAEPTVSRHHARIELVPDGVRITDLDSLNGSTYLGQRFSTIVLSPGARVQLGTATLALDPDAEELALGQEYTGGSYRGVLGVSVQMRQLFGILKRLESCLATVLIEGESGTGKECVARAIHEGSRVHGKPLVIVNCGAIPRNLVASELFGHRRGAFTGALDHRRGAFESAHGGTLFLDEIGELPIDIQPALLRVLETGEVRPVGGDESRYVDVRVLAATNRDLESEVAARRFRQDLFFRLAVLRLRLPPLRGRPEDVELLATAFAERLALAELPPSVMERLKCRTWPGNARELKNAVQAYVAIGQLPSDGEGPVAHLEHALRAASDLCRSYTEQKELVVDLFTKVYLTSLLRHVDGNQSEAARIAGLDRTYFGRLLARHQIAARRRGRARQ
jgi:transcriptional regulator with GAF, ATPase, and Fis domain